MIKINKEIKDTIKDVIEFVIKLIIYILKWMCLLAAVTFGGLTIGYLIIAIIKNVTLANTLVAKISSYITFYNESEILKFIELNGTGSVIVASIAYGFAHSLSYSIMYYLLDKYLEIFKKFKSGRMFTKEIYTSIKNCVYLSLICTIANPLIITVAFLSTRMLGTSHINYSGIVYVIFSYTIYIIYKKGYELSKENKELKKEVNKKEIVKEDKKIEEVKKEVISTKNKKNTNKKKTEKK